MTDLRRALHEAATPRRQTPPPAFLVAADLDRGRRELRRGRTVVGFGSGLAAAAAAGLVVVVLQSGVVPATVLAVASAPPVPARVTPENTTSPLQSVALVAYEGEQPKGFQLDKIPEGWEVTGVDEGMLLLGFVGDTQVPLEFGLEVLVNRYGPEAVFAGDSELGRFVTEVTVGDVTGEVYYLGAEAGMQDDEDGEGGYLWLQVPQPSGEFLVVQVPEWVGWSNEQLAEFGAAVRITDDAVTSDSVG